MYKESVGREWFLPSIAGFSGFVEIILSVDSSLDFTIFDTTDFIGNIGRMELVGISAFICSPICPLIAILFDESACLCWQKLLKFYLI